MDRCEELRLFDDARRMVRYWADLADDLLARRPAPAPPSRLYASRHHGTGELRLDGTLNPVDGEIVGGELRRLSTEIRLEDERSGVRRTPAQRRAAALTRMASRSVNATGISARPLFQVIVGDETARRLCELASGTVVHPTELVGRIDDAVMETFLFDGPSVVIAKSHRRTFTGALRRAIQVRDRRCQHPSGCRVAAGECDVDHIQPAAAGGATTQFNGRAECIPHNRLAHLHDRPPPYSDPAPERPLDRLDEIRARLRWRMLHEQPDGAVGDDDLAGSSMGHPSALTRAARR